MGGAKKFLNFVTLDIAEIAPSPLQVANEALASERKALLEAEKYAAYLVTELRRAKSRIFHHSAQIQKILGVRADALQGETAHE
jgi:hypothetical protein